MAELSGRTVGYDYDALHRLTGEVIAADPDGINGSTSWGYDAVSNRESQASTIAGVLNQSFTHDANDRLDTHEYNQQGQTLQDENGALFTWNFQNRLESKAGGTEGDDVTLIYNGDGQLVSKTAGGVTTEYLIDDLNPTGYSQIVEEIVNGQTQVVFPYGHDLISQDRIDATGTTWQVTYYGYDGHGSVRFLTNQTGQITDTYTYDAYGKLLSANGQTANAYLYAGERWVTELGLSYNRARFLSTTHGRFWSMDEYEGSTQQPVTLNKYLYANAGPVMGVDPSGYFTLASQLNTLAVRAINFAYFTAPRASFFTVGFVDFVIGSVDPGYVGGPGSYAGKSVRLTASQLGKINQSLKGGVAAYLSVSIKLGNSRGAGLYKWLKEWKVPGTEINHLNQDAAFGSIIPYIEGASIRLKGTIHEAFEHRRFHKSLEGFWDMYREGGKLKGLLPACGDYHKALIKALEDVGYPLIEAEALADFAKANREAYGLFNSSLVPKIPERIPYL